MDTYNVNHSTSHVCCFDFFFLDNENYSNSKVGKYLDPFFPIGCSLAKNCSNLKI